MADAFYTSTVAILNFVNNEIVDRSPVARAFSAMNGAGLVTGTPTVLRLDGTNDYVESAAGGADYAFPGQFCIEIVCKKSASGSADYDTALTTDASNASAYNGWIVELGTARGFTFVTNNSDLLLSWSGAINDGNVHHWCVRRGADNVVRLSKDGSQVASATYSDAITSTGFLGVGRNSALLAYPFAGDVLAVRITKGTDRYSGTSFTPDSAPFADYPLQLAGNVKDATGSNAARKVIAIRESTNQVIATTTSNATTGNYVLPASVAEGHTLVFYPAVGENLPALVLRGVVPV